MSSHTLFFHFCNFCRQFQFTLIYCIVWNHQGKVPCTQKGNDMNQSPHDDRRQVHVLLLMGMCRSLYSASCTEVVYHARLSFCYMCLLTLVWLFTGLCIRGLFSLSVSHLMYALDLHHPFFLLGSISKGEDSRGDSYLVVFGPIALHLCNVKSSIYFYELCTDPADGNKLPMGSDKAIIYDISMLSSMGQATPLSDILTGWTGQSDCKVSSAIQDSLQSDT